jgi:MFS family permease
MTVDRPFRFRSIALPALGPTLLFSIGEGAILPVIPSVADGLGATLAIAGFIASLIALGTLLGDIPSGWVVSRVGERNAMIGASLISLVGLAIALFAPNPWVLAVGVLFIGIATAAFSLARHAFMTSFVPVEYRARALSTLGGTFRLGLFVGPFVAAAIIHLTGGTQAVFLVHVAGCLGAAALLLAFRDPSEKLRGRTSGERLVEGEAVGLFRTLRQNLPVLARLGTGAALVGALRSSRQVILPLWALSIGVPHTQTALVIGIAGAVDFALFYTGGQIMDRFGRLWTAVPSMIGLGIGHLVLAFSHDLSSATAWFVVAAILMSLANGIGSGIIMTLGADLADPRNPAPFLGAWRFTGDLGNAAAPLAVSAVTAAASIAAAGGLMGVLGFVGAAVLLRYIPRFTTHTPRGRRQEHATDAAGLQ